MRVADLRATPEPTPFAPRDNNTADHNRQFNDLPRSEQTRVSGLCLSASRVMHRRSWVQSGHPGIDRCNAGEETSMSSVRSPLRLGRGARKRPPRPPPWGTQTAAEYASASQQPAQQHLPRQETTYSSTQRSWRCQCCNSGRRVKR